jgi:hypothetical protein
MNKIGKWILVVFLGLLGVYMILPFFPFPYTFFGVEFVNLPFFGLLENFYLLAVQLWGWIFLGIFLGGSNIYYLPYYIFYLLLWVISIIAATMIGYSKGRALKGFILGFFLTWLGVSIIIVMKTKPVQGNRNGEPGA